MTAAAHALPKLDLRKQHKEFYLPSATEVVFVDVPEFLFVMVDGVIESGVTPSESESFADAMSAMYGIGYRLKFMSKQAEDPVDFGVMPVEGTWATESGDPFEWDWREPSHYTLLMMQPDHITPAMFEAAVAGAKSKALNGVFDDLRLERWREGPSIQIMHIGPYSDEPTTLAKMDDFADENGYAFCGRHHEIYIGDPSRAKPEKLKTVLRHPVKV